MKKRKKGTAFFDKLRLSFDAFGWEELLDGNMVEHNIMIQSKRLRKAEKIEISGRWRKSLLCRILSKIKRTVFGQQITEKHRMENPDVLQF